ncbi:hypothetical protein BS78_01G499200 [Paspalum vaginatum]|nr:hypothetical protein BS78_01G499200 [Paspalum vaginatum]
MEATTGSYMYIYGVPSLDQYLSTPQRMEPAGSNVRDGQRPSWGLKEVTNDHDSGGGECAICLRDLHAAEEEKLRAMPCSHAFHQECIFQWLRGNAVCPLCRHQLEEEQEDLEQELYDEVMRLLSE